MFPQNFWDQILLISYYNKEVGVHFLEAMWTKLDRH
jgi:hypothetical protein